MMATTKQRRGLQPRIPHNSCRRAKFLLLSLFKNKYFSSFCSFLLVLCKNRFLLPSCSDFWLSFSCCLSFSFVLFLVFFPTHSFCFLSVFLFFCWCDIYLLLAGRMSEDRVVLGGFDRAEARLSTVRHLVLSACGTSLFAAMYGAKLMRDLEALDTATVRYTATRVIAIYCCTVPWYTTAVQLQYRGTLLLYNTLLVQYCTAVHYQYNTTAVYCYCCAGTVPWCFTALQYPAGTLLYCCTLPV